MAEARRTVVVKLDMDDSDATLLHETVEEYLWACNYVVRDAWQDDYKPTSKTELHDRTYSDVREQTRLQANLVQSARNKAAEAIKGVVARWQNGKKASQPHFTTPSVRYDKRSATFHDDRVSLSTVNGRIEAEYVLPPEGDNPHTKYLRDDDYEVTGATLQYRDATDTFFSTSEQRLTWGPRYRTKATPRTAQSSAWTSVSNRLPSRQPECSGAAITSITAVGSTSGSVAIFNGQARNQPTEQSNGWATGRHGG